LQIKDLKQAVELREETANFFQKTADVQAESLNKQYESIKQLNQEIIEAEKKITALEVGLTEANEEIQEGVKVIAENEQEISNNEDELHQQKSESETLKANSYVKQTEFEKKLEAALAAERGHSTNVLKDLQTQHTAAINALQDKLTEATANQAATYYSARTSISSESCS